MASNFPTGLDSFTEPNPDASLAYNAHKQRHVDLQNAIVAVETRIGVAGSADATSIEKRLTNDVAALSAHQSAGNPHPLYMLSANHAEEHIALRTPQTLWASGQIFWLPPGDGGANGLLFAGGGTGAFTLSAAVPAGFSVPQLWIYLTADAGGSGNPAGWHYATMSSDVAGIVYADRYDSTSGVVPVFPASPATLNCTSATRLTTTTTDIQMFQVPVNFATQMGLNGLIEMAFKTFGNNAASSKFLSLRAGTNLLYQNIPTTNPVMDWGVAVSTCGSLSRQLITRQANSQHASAVTTVSNDFRSVNLAAETTLNVGIKLSATTDSFAVAVRKLSMIYGG